MIVKSVPSEEEKSLAEREAALLAQHADKNEESEKTPEAKTEGEEVEAGKEEGTVVIPPEVLDMSGANAPVVPEVPVVETPVAEVPIVETPAVEAPIVDVPLTAKRDLPEDVEAYLKYREETGRGFEDYVNLNRDLSKADPDELLRGYLLETQVGLDASDIATQMEEDYSFDVDIDDQRDINRKTRAKKIDIAKAKEHYAKQQEAYGVPLESRTDAAPRAESEEEVAYKQYLTEAANAEAASKVVGDHFLSTTEALFGAEFKGFEFGIDDQTLTYSPAETSELKKVHSDPSNFTKKFIDEKGLLKDPEGYHRALSIAMNPEKYAKFFYEQGRAGATDATMKGLKNIDMETRSVPAPTTKSGFKVKAVGAPERKGLTIKTIKNL